MIINFLLEKQRCSQLYILALTFIAQLIIYLSCNFFNIINICVKMNYYLAGQETKKKMLIKALNQFARDRSVEELAQSLKGILKMPVERKLLKDIR